MNKKLFCFLALTALGLVAVNAGAGYPQDQVAAEPQDQQISGNIVSVNTEKGLLVVAVAGANEGETEEVSVIVDDKTTIEKNGGIVAFGDLAQGDDVEIIFAVDAEGNKVAQDITVSGEDD